MKCQMLKKLKKLLNKEKKIINFDKIFNYYIDRKYIFINEKKIFRY